MYNELGVAIVMGLIGGFIPGPVLTAIFTEILQSSLTKSLRIVFWAMLTETIVALICLQALTFLNLSEGLFQAISLVGAVILIWIASSIWKIKKINSHEKIHFSPAKISAMILSNGVLWTFWMTISVPKAISLSQRLAWGQYVFLIVFEVGWLAATLFLAFVFSRFRNTLSDPKIVPVVFKIFSLTFVYFALDMIYKSIKFFLASGFMK